MTLALVFNHHLLPFDDIEQAKAGIHQFIQIVTSCNRRYGIGLLLLDNAVGRSLFDVNLPALLMVRNGLIGPNNKVN